MEDWTDLFKKRNKDELGFHRPENNKYKDNAELSANVCKEAQKEFLHKKFKKLKHKTLYLNIELEDVSNNFKNAQKVFIQTMIEYCKRKNIKPPFEKYSPKNETKELDDETVKELYREIVKKTHPDKTQTLDSDTASDLNDLYLRANEGKTEGDPKKILNVALDMDIDIDDLNLDIIKMMQEGIKETNAKIKKMKEDIMYKWFYADTDQQQKIFETLTQNCKPINQ